MSDKWISLPGGKRMLHHERGFIIIMPDNPQDPIPIFCPVCDLPMHDADDVHYFQKYACCYPCGMKWADANQERWNEGWRPAIDIIKEEVRLRQLLRKQSAGPRS